MLIPKFQDIAIANYSSWIFLKLISFFDPSLILFHFVTVSDNWKVGLRIRDFWWGSRPSIRDPSNRKDQGTLNMGPDTRDPGPWKWKFLSFLWSLAIMNEFMCLMRLCLFCMFPITLCYGMNTFNLLSATLSQLLEKTTVGKFNFYHAAALNSHLFKFPRKKRNQWYK